MRYGAELVGKKSFLEPAIPAEGRPTVSREVLSLTSLACGNH